MPEFPWAPFFLFYLKEKKRKENYTEKTENVLCKINETDPTNIRLYFIQT